MQTRLRLLMGATALLYIGPLLAGLGGFGWGQVLAFWAIFMAWLFVLRPQQWPRSLHDWKRAEGLTVLVTNTLVQLFLVAMLFGVGRGIGGVLGRVPHYSAGWPLLISFLAIPLSRWAWNPWNATSMDGLLEQAIQKVADPQHKTADANGLTAARRMIAPLANLPDDISETEVAKHLFALSNHIEAEDLRHALLERAHARDVGRAEIMAMILHCTDGSLIKGVTGDGPTLALAALPDDPTMVALFSRRLAQALDEDPDVWGKCPNVDLLQTMVEKYDNTSAEAALRDLIDATNAAQPEGSLL